VSYRKRADLVVLAIVVTLVVVAALQSTKTAAAQETVVIAPTAKLIKGGQAVLVELQVTCPQGKEVLEAHISVSQDDSATYGLSGIPVKCTGKPHTYKTVVTAQQGQFHTGTAYASAYVLLYDPATGTTESASATEPALQVR
jgi:hypothetical protein